MTRALTLEDIFAVERVIDAQISPDGARVAFVVTREFTEGEHAIPASSVWIVPYDGNTPARLFTASVHADTSPRWSPDGRSLAFLSDRERADTLQVYVMPTDGGEARKLTSAKAGVSEFSWSPDGARIAYLAADAKTEDEEKREKERDDAIHVDHDYKFTRLWVIDAAGGEARAITPPAYQVRGFASRDSGWAIVTSPTPKEDDIMAAWSVRLVAEGSQDSESHALWQGAYPVLPITSSRDGRAIAWAHSGAVGEESADEVWVAQAGEEPRLVISDYSGMIAGIHFTPDGKALLLIGVDGTRTLLGRLDLDSGATETLLAGRTFASTFASGPEVSVSADGVRMACVLEDVNQPPEVFVGELGGEPRKVTACNARFAETALGRGETIEWTAPDGLRIEGVLIYPVDYEEGKRYPLIAQIHGGPTGMWLMRFMAGWHDWGQWLATHGYAVLLPNPRGSAGRGREYAWSNRRNWGHGDLDDVLSGVDALIARGLADPDRLGIGGWSYGGYLTAWTIGQTDRFKAAVVGAGVTDLLSFQAADIPSWLPGQMMLAPSYQEPEVYLRSSPITYVAQAKTPTLITHGASDERVRLGQGKELYHALRALGVPTEMVIYPREPHIFQERHHQRDLLTRVGAWFDRWVKGDTESQE
ncbi:MAG TPA: S9 family peptidase [Ktedonobacterales bacterium]|jgi:dipeptidyl aminopeptidase/acylaminoacyl peptidase|nr:S9 family peptidase [Ktedonobacterales bacterium]